SFFLKYRKLWARGDGSIFQREGQVAGLSEQDAVHQQARFRGWRLPSRLKPRFSPNSEPAAAPQRRPKRPQQLLRAPLPGQGSQFVGMGRGLLKYPNVKEMFTVAQKILGYDLCSDLLAFTSTGVSRTDVWQSCVSGAATDKPAKRQMSGVEARDGSAAAGGVDGEAAAGVDGGAAAGGVDAETMQKASELVPSGMLSVIGRPQDQYNYACLQAKEHCKSLGMENPVCSVANYRFPDGRVIAGHQQALDFLQENSRRLKFMRTKTLPVSGAFHTELMASATEPLREVLRQVEVSQPLYPKGINMHKHAFNYSVKKISLEIFLGPVLTFQLVCLVQWWSSFSLSYLGHVSEYCTPCAFGHSSDVAALKYGQTGGKWHLGSCTLDFSQFMGSYFAPWFFHTLLATLLTILNERLIVR
uniref:Malonyl-CoA-acyl carrier protein transacylase, mitochondrial n=1 Tax=Oreochromis aureus TaxID=47969 RepID=A0AAZ1X5D9_OREAU